MTYLRIRPSAPETFTVPEAVKVSGLDEPPPTVRRPDLARAWAEVMTSYRETRDTSR